MLNQGRPRSRRVRALCTLLAIMPLPLVAARTHADGGFELVARVQIKPDANDLSGLEGTIGKDIPHTRFGAFGSAIDFTGANNTFIAAPDRGPGDGITQYRCRVHAFTLTFPETGRAELTLTRTTLLSDEAGRALVGWSGAIDADAAKSLRYDPEGVRALPDGTFVISEEYGPAVDQFSAEGRRIRRFAVPDKFRVKVHAENPADELPPHNTRGRQPNRGFEGLALSRDGKTLYTMPQSPLMQDGAFEPTPPKPGAEPKRAGHNIRILAIDIASGATREVVYVLDSPRHGVSEIAADEDGSLIVLERDGKGGSEAKVRRLYTIDLAGATDVSNIDALPREAIASSGTSTEAVPGKAAGAIRPVRKTLLLDLMDPAFGLAGPSMPEKIEAVTTGPKLSDGRRSLIVASDNDMKADQPTWVWVFARR